MKPLLPTLLLLCFCLTGCSERPSPPTLRAADRITAQLHSVPNMSIQGIDEIEIPPDKVAEVLLIVTPVTFEEHGIHPLINPHIADIYLHHADDYPTKIEVRETGHNPAAVTIDGSRYFYASVDGPVAGAHELARVLIQIHHNASQAERQGDQ